MTHAVSPDQTASSEAGFTLFESLVALSVFSLVAISTLTLVSQNLRSSTMAEAKTYAGFVAENVLVDTRLQQNLPLGESGGEAEMGGFEFEWSRDIAETGEGTLRQVRVDVHLKDQSQTLVSRLGFRKD